MNSQAQMPEHKTNSYVNDFANVIDDIDEPILDKKIRDFKDKSSIEMTIVTITSLDGQDVDSYSNELFRKWGIGTKELNNGILMLISVTDRKWRIEIGDGIEEYITDGYARTEAQSKLVPFLKKKDYTAGFNALVDDFIGKLGPLSWQERKDLKIKQAEQMEKDKQAFNDSLVTFFTWFGIIGAAIAAFVILYITDKRKKEKIIAEARDKKMKLEKLTSDNNTVINDYNKMLAWAKENRTVFTADLNKYDDAKKKLDDLLTQRNLSIESMESEKLLMRNISSALTESIRVVYVKFAEFNTLKSSINSYYKITQELNTAISNTNSNYTRMVSTYSSSVVEIAFPEKMLLNKLNDLNSSILNLQKIINNGAINGLKNDYTFEKYDELKKGFDSIQTSEKEIRFHLKVVNDRLNKINEAVKYVSNNRSRITSLLNDVKRRIGNSDVSSSTKTKFVSVESKAAMYTEANNPLIAYTEMYTLINDLDSVKRKADDDIAEEERKRKRKIEEEEEDERRRTASLYSSSSSFDSSSSSSSNSSNFGGGSSSGGGASGDW